MKKIRFLILPLLILSVMLVGCEKKGYTTISYEELNKKIENKETFALFIGRETCSACSLFKEVLNQNANNHKGVVFYYIDLDSVTDEEDAKLSTKYDSSRTPTTYIIIEGNTPTSYDKFVGSDQYSNIINAFKNKGILK